MPQLGLCQTRIAQGDPANARPANGRAHKREQKNQRAQTRLITAAELDPKNPFFTRAAGRPVKKQVDGSVER